MNEDDERFITEVVESKGIPLIGMIPYDENIREADRLSLAPLDLNEGSPAVIAIKKMKEELLIRLNELPTVEKEAS